MKKLLLLLPALVVSAFFLMGADVASAQSSIYSAGDLIKTADRSTVYYFGFDGKRHAFPNESTYFSWYSNFDGLKIVTPEELANITLGHNIVVRPGTHLIKIESDPKVYVVEPYGVLRHIPSEQMAKELYGNNWARKVIDLNVAFWPNYDIREAISLNATVHPKGTVFRYLGDNRTYIFRNGKAIPFLNLAQAEAHRYQERFILTLAKPSNTENPSNKLKAVLVDVNLNRVFDYQIAIIVIDQIKPVLIDVAQTLVEDLTSTITIINNYCDCDECENCDDCEDGCDNSENPYINLTNNDGGQGGNDDILDPADNPYINLSNNNVEEDEKNNEDDLVENPYVNIINNDEPTEEHPSDGPLPILVDPEDEQPVDNPFINLTNNEQLSDGPLPIIYKAPIYSYSYIGLTK